MADGSGRTDLLCKVCTGQTSFPTYVFIPTPVVTCLAGVCEFAHPLLITKLEGVLKTSPRATSGLEEAENKVVVVVRNAERIVRTGGVLHPPPLV